MTFETDELNKAQLKQLRSFLNTEITAFFEIRKTGEEKYIVVIFNPTIQEEYKIVEFLEHFEV